MKTGNSSKGVLFFVLDKSKDLNDVELHDIVDWDKGNGTEEEALGEAQWLVDSTRGESYEKRISLKDLKIVKVSYVLEEIEIKK